jgi:hypothetical protein
MISLKMRDKAQAFAQQGLRAKNLLPFPYLKSLKNLSRRGNQLKFATIG